VRIGELAVKLGLDTARRLVHTGNIKTEVGPIAQTRANRTMIVIGSASGTGVSIMFQFHRGHGAARGTPVATSSPSACTRSERPPWRLHEPAPTTASASTSSPISSRTSRTPADRALRLHLHHHDPQRGHGAGPAALAPLDHHRPTARCGSRGEGVVESQPHLQHRRLPLLGAARSSRTPPGARCRASTAWSRDDGVTSTPESAVRLAVPGLLH